MTCHTRESMDFGLPDDERARDPLETTMLVGMTYADRRGERLDQFREELASVDKTRGICLRLAGHRSGEIFWLPPDLRSVFAPPAGSYRLRSNREIVENPDYTAAWAVHPQSG